MSSNVVALPGEPERRRRRFFGGGKEPARHKRTPEAWAAMVERAQIAEAREASATARADRLERERDDARSEVKKLSLAVDELTSDMRSLGHEVSRMRALMSADPADQNTVTIIPPGRDVDETQLMSRAELFADGDPMKPLRPVIRVGEIKPPSSPAPDAAARFVDRITSQSEKVRHVEATQPIPLWDSPMMAQGSRAQRRTA